MTHSSTPAQGWAFLVARGHETGYQLLLAPDFVLTGREPGLLMNEVQGEVPESGPPVVTTMVGPVSGPLGVVHQTARLTRADVGLADRPEAPLRDRVGRPLLLAYGFVCRGVRVVAVDDRDLGLARDAAMATYQRFYAAEDDFLPEASHPYPVSSSVTPAAATPAPPAGPQRQPAPWTSQVLPKRQQPTPRRPAMILGVLVVALTLVGGIYIALRESPVEVPDINGKSQLEAIQLVDKAGLVLKTMCEPNDKPVGTVVRAEPHPGEHVPPGSEVRIWVSTGQVPTKIPSSAAEASCPPPLLSHPTAT